VKLWPLSEWIPCPCFYTRLECQHQGIPAQAQRVFQPWRSCRPSFLVFSRPVRCNNVSSQCGCFRVTAPHSWRMVTEVLNAAMDVEATCLELFLPDRGKREERLGQLCPDAGVVEMELDFPFEDQFVTGDQVCLDCPSRLHACC
jgi:hypothetical protein